MIYEFWCRGYDPLRYEKRLFSVHVRGDGPSGIIGGYEEFLKRRPISTEKLSPGLLAMKRVLTILFSGLTFLMSPVC
jgi:hypothetical protein